MSSQGPQGATGASGIPKGYRWTNLSVRDSSDWTSYRKQQLIYNSATVARTGASAEKLSKYERPWFVNGQDYKLDFLNGRNKCLGCTGGAFNGATGPISN